MKEALESMRTLVNKPLQNDGKVYMKGAVYRMNSTKYEGSTNSMNDKQDEHVVFLYSGKYVPHLITKHPNGYQIDFNWWVEIDPKCYGQRKFTYCGIEYEFVGHWDGVI